MSDSMKHFYLEKMVGNTYAVYEEKVDGLEDDAIDVVLVSDHDRIVAAQKNHLDDIYTEELFRKEQAIAELRAEVERLRNGCNAIAPWMSAAGEDPKVCKEMKADIDVFFAAIERAEGEKEHE